MRITSTKPRTSSLHEAVMTKKTIYVIIPAAGRSERMGGSVPKIMMDLAGIPVIIRTLRAFEDFSYNDYVMRTVVVTGRSLTGGIRALIAEYGITCVEDVIEGGATRTESVGRGVSYLRDLGIGDSSIVFIHDGARCLIDQDTLHSCADALTRCDVCAAAVPAKNTIKITGDTEDGLPVVESTPDRDRLMEIQTPQCFRFNVLSKAYRYAEDNNITATDDTALAELLGYKVCLCRGSYSNIKITTPEDIRIAEALIRQ